MGLAGFLGGMMLPSRDMLVRKAAPPGAAGRVFGIVSTGFNIGGIVGPLMFGWIMDHGAPVWVFGVAVGLLLATSLFAFISERRGAKAGDGPPVIPAEGAREPGPRIRWPPAGSRITSLREVPG